MDRKVPPPDIPPPAIDTLKTKIKQSVHKVAFEDALQQAHARQHMSQGDRVDAASMRQQLHLERHRQPSWLSTKQSDIQSSHNQSALRVDRQARRADEEKAGAESFGSTHTQSLPISGDKHAGMSSSNLSFNRAVEFFELDALLRQLQMSNLSAEEAVSISVDNGPMGIDNITLKGSRNSGYQLLITSDQHHSTLNEYSENLVNGLEFYGHRVKQVAVRTAGESA
ncbi:MAG: hypothetical protein KTR35_16110 [Gammaproteobacteria bacterium]|nr:hypothetical protein [Gammaproteobacteria bacterium]